jgi:hypothetical protein
MSFSINGLTQEQVEMLDQMWELESEEEFLIWYACLDEDKQHTADLLQRLLIMEAMDKDLMGTKKFPDAKKALSKFML